MMWDKLEYPPQPFGQCSICSRHECGDVIEDGVKKQKWLHVPLELFAGGDLHVGYQCVRGMSEDLGVAVRVVEKTIHNEPSDEQLLRVMRSAIEVYNDIRDGAEVVESITSDGNEEEVVESKPKTRQRRASK